MTAEEKQFKKDYNALIHVRNKAIVEWSTKKLKTYEDLLAFAGHNRDTVRCYYPTMQLSSPLTRQQIFDYFGRIQLGLEYRRDHIGDIYRNDIIPHEYEGISYPPNEPVTLELVTKEEFVRAVQESMEIRDFLAEHEVLPPSPKQKCYLFPFQERAAATLYHGIVQHRRAAQLLRAAVGTGKTYIIAAVIRRLLDMGFCDGKTFSPWPMLYVTKATIVEQTERVFNNQFGINTSTECRVINIEQLRASLGELMVRCETVVVRGEETLIWKWREQIHPIIFFFDECQILKNEDSQQSQIVQAISRINHPHIHCIFFSATPFLRVVDTKCFVLNARINVRGQYE